MSHAVVSYNVPLVTSTSPGNIGGGGQGGGQTRREVALSGRELGMGDWSAEARMGGSSAEMT
eukprot:3416687-Rhodomonas_salina.1